MGEAADYIPASFSVFLQVLTVPVRLKTSILFIRDVFPAVYVSYFQSVLICRAALNRSMARSNKCIINSRYGIPDASHILGNIEIAVKPGMVFTSFR